MVTVTIPKKEYKDLIAAKLRYDYLRQIMKEDIFSPPPVQSREAVLSSFKATKQYNKKFLDGLKKGLNRSSYFNRA